MKKKKYSKVFRFRILSLHTSKSMYSETNFLIVKASFLDALFSNEVKRNLRKNFKVTQSKFTLNSALFARGWIPLKTKMRLKTRF